MNTDNSYYMGIDIGGTKCAVSLGLSGEKIKITDRISYATKKGTRYTETIQEIFCGMNDLLQKNRLNQNDVKAIGISCEVRLTAGEGKYFRRPIWSDGMMFPLWT